MIFRNNNFCPPVLNRKKVTPNRERSPSKNGIIEDSTRSIYPINFQSNDNNSQRNLSPNKLNATKKPFANLGSPKVNIIQRQYSSPRLEMGNNLNLVHCSKHPEKCAQFLTKISGQGTLYCERCAIQLASQGIQMLRLNGHQNVNRKGKPKQSLKKEKHEGRGEFEEVNKFLQALNVSEQRQNVQINRLMNIGKHYKSQLKMTERFYNELIETLIQMRDDHMQDLMKQGQKQTQVAEIEQSYLSQNLEQIKLFKNDIEGQYDFILQEYKQNISKFQEIMHFYRNKVSIFQMKNEEIDAFFQNLIDYKTKDLNKQMKNIQNYILQSWEKNQQNDLKNYKFEAVERVKGKNQPKHLRNEELVGNHLRNENVTYSSKKIGNILHLNYENQNYKNEKNFCRKLFNDQNADVEKSPEFKNI